MYWRRSIKQQKEEYSHAQYLNIVLKNSFWVNYTEVHSSLVVWNFETKSLIFTTNEYQSHHPGIDFQSPWFLTIRVRPEKAISRPYMIYRCISVYVIDISQYELFYFKDTVQKKICLRSYMIIEFQVECSISVRWRHFKQ